MVDLDGRFVIPGLTEMHAHVPVRRFDAGASDYRADVLFLWVANGVTLARGMMGHPSHLELRGALAANEALGPTLLIFGTVLQRWQRAHRGRRHPPRTRSEGGGL